MWQRVWASEDRRTVYGGAVIGFALSTTLIFIIGFGGWLALAWGFVNDETNPNLYFFTVRGLGEVQLQGRPLQGASVSVGASASAARAASLHAGGCM